MQFQTIKAGHVTPGLETYQDHSGLLLSVVSHKLHCPASAVHILTRGGVPPTTLV